MTSNVFPESMNPIDYKQSEKSLKVIDEYIRYMCERTTYSVSNVLKKAAAAGNSSAEIYSELEDLKTTVSTLSSTVASLSGAVSSLQTDYTNLEARVKALEEKE